MNLAILSASYLRKRPATTLLNVLILALGIATIVVLPISFFMVILSGSLLDLITVKFLLSYSGRPLQFFGIPGLVSGFVGSVMAVCLSIQKLIFDVPLADRPALLLAILLILIGIQFIVFGLLGELQIRTEATDEP